MKNKHTYSWMKRTAGLLITVVTGWGAFSDASIMVSVNDTIPTENVLASFDPTIGLSSLQWRDNDSAQRDIGQSFLATSSTIMNSFSLKASGTLQQGAFDAPFTVTIYENSSDDALGSTISTQSGTYFSAGTAIDEKWMTFDIDNLSLTSGNYYAFVLSFDNAGVADQDQTVYQSTEGYSSGRRWYSVSDSFTTSTSYDLAFSVQVVPEPASMGLISFGGVCLLALRRRFRH